MKLGTLNLKNNLILAPMMNVTTGPYRRFCRYFHDIGLVCLPMLFTKALAASPKSMEQELVKIEEERPISVQLIGSDLQFLKKSIDYLESYKFDVLDINAGCPSKRATHSQQGGYLLKNLEKLNQIIQKAVKYSSRPVSLKTRIGFKERFDLAEFKEYIDNSGLAFITFHSRTVLNKSNENALDLDFLKKIKENLSIPVVGNGDIYTPEFAKYVLEFTNVDALMIGRASMGNPLIFNQIHNYILNKEQYCVQNNLELMKNNIKIYKRILNDFVDSITLKYSIEEFKFTELKRNSIWLTKSIKDSTELRRKISMAKDLYHLESLLNNI